MADEYAGVDLYEVLGLEAGADEKEVARAYKKQSLVHHPDRGGDVKLFLKLKHARDVLLDPKQKSEYDKKLSQELMARKRQLEREAELSNRRKQMRDDQLRKEQGAAQLRQQERDEIRRRHQLSKLREQAVARQRELQDNLARQARRQSEIDKASTNDASVKGSKSERTVTVKWDRRQISHSEESIIRALRGYGEIESVKLKSSSAKVLFADKRAAVQAVRIEGHKDAWREVSLQGHIIDSDAVEFQSAEEEAESTATVLPRGPISLHDHLEFEQHVLRKLHDRIEQKRAAAGSAPRVAT